jgi:AcrR family transcriptional regulator
MADGKAQRRRGALLEAALLEAAWEELLAVGYANLTLKGVAGRAGTGRAVLYRRWPDRAELVLAAMNHRAPLRPFELPDTGELRADVLVILRRVVARYQEIRPILAVLVTEFLNDPEFADHVQARSLGKHPDMMLTILERAAERGEVRPDRITPRIAGLPIQLTLHDLLLTQGRTTEATLAQILDEVLLPLVRP